MDMDVVDAVTSNGVAALLALALLSFGALAVWRRVRVRLPGGIEIGHDDTDVTDLQTILTEQRRGYDHLASRVATLETRVADLETQLVAARAREADLERALSAERTSAGERIAHLEAALAAAQDRIAELERLLAEAAGN